MATPAIPPASPKADPETLELRASPRPVTRLNRRMLAVMAGTLGIVILGATLWSLQPHKRSADQTNEPVNVDRVSRTERLDQLPRDYSKVVPLMKPAVPALGEPLPGDLGPAIVHVQNNANMTGYNPHTQFEHAAQTGDAGDVTGSSVFFRSSASTKAAPTNTVSAIQPEQTTSNQSFDPMTSTQSTDSTAAQNQQDQKEAFLTKAGDSTTRNLGGRQPPVSPYQVMAGTIIPAALVTGIDSDLPGQVIASVTEAVYDTATGRYLLIPQGSRLIGRYDSQVAFGQHRVLLVWTRLILPDTSSISLDRLPGIDPAGYAGLEDGVDWHWDRILAGAALSTLLGVGAELAAPQNSTNGNVVVVGTRQGAQGTVNQVGQEITKRNMNIQPTLTIRPGFPMRVMVNKDLILRPYEPLFFQKGSSQ